MILYPVFSEMKNVVYHVGSLEKRDCQVLGPGNGQVRHALILDYFAQDTFDALIVLWVLFCKSFQFFIFFLFKKQLFEVAAGKIKF